MVAQLVSKGNAYERNGSVYFDSNSAALPKKLSFRPIDSAKVYGRQNATKGIGDKRLISDFALWKACADESELGWMSTFGRGRPGMSLIYLKVLQIDLLFRLAY